MMNSQIQVLVTGGSGFIAGHCIIQLLDEGYRVRATMRSLDREPEVRAQLGLASRDADGELSFVAADLTSDEGWGEAVGDCDVVLHIASPVPHDVPGDDDEMVAIATAGTLRVLRAAADAGVRRVVLTSAFHAIGFGYGRTDRTFTEDDWAKLDGPGIDAYGKSKTLAERAAWDFIASDRSGMELVTINPVAVLGPITGSSVSGANEVVRRILDGALPGYPDLWIPIVDVRDVAAAHILAMSVPEAAGQRFILASDNGMTMAQIGATLRDALGERAKRVPTRKIPTFVMRVAALFDKTARAIGPDLGVTKKISNRKARDVLGVQLRPAVETVVVTAESMFEAGIVTT